MYLFFYDRLQEYLGSGQFGTVNRGVWSPSPSSSNPGVEVAVKSLEGESTEEERVKFLQEAAIMGQFKHPNIIRIAGVITTSDPVRYEILQHVPWVVHRECLYFYTFAVADCV